MKTIHSVVFFVLVLVVVAFIFLILKENRPDEDKILLQTLDCQSDKIDASVYNLQGHTSLVGAIITFNRIPLSEDERKTLTELGIVLDEDSLIIDHMIARIPSESICPLVEIENISIIFIPETSLNLTDYEIKNN